MKPQRDSDSSLHSSDSGPLVLIPAAGYGTRVGSPAAKELFPDPNGSPLIAFGLDQARRRSWPVHVITRKEKIELVRYLEDYRQKWSMDLEIQIIEPSREWPDTLLKSQPFWREKNLLCLPDTVFEPKDVWDRLAGSAAELAVAVFNPSESENPELISPFSTWGVFQIPSSEQKLSVCEKPLEQNLSPSCYKAWGILCWHQKVGPSLLQAQLESSQDHLWKNLDMSFESFELVSFQDVTRGR